jgi:hypothetical protein
MLCSVQQAFETVFKLRWANECEGFAVDGVTSVDAVQLFCRDLSEPLPQVVISPGHFGRIPGKITSNSFFPERYKLNSYPGLFSPSTLYSQCGLTTICHGLGSTICSSSMLTMKLTSFALIFLRSNGLEMLFRFRGLFFLFEKYALFLINRPVGILGWVRSVFLLLLENSAKNASATGTTSR